MNKMKCFSAALVAVFLSATHLCAQDIEKEFDDFAKQQQQEFEDFKNISIAFKTNSSQKSSYRQFLFTVDVSVHHIVDVRSELDP